MAELKKQELDKIARTEQAEIQEARGTLTKVQETGSIEAAKAALDIAGIADPTPISDGASCALALATGDYWGAFWSSVSMVPYLGDAVGKPAKALKAAWKAEELAEVAAKATKKLLKAQKSLDQKNIAASKKAAEIVQAKRAKEGMGNCKYGTQIPKRGTWKGEPGNSVWTSDAGHNVPYKDGHPQFDKAYKIENGVKVPAVHPDGPVTIPDMVGDTRADFKAANEAMKTKLNNPDWKQPKGYTWHHGEDGSSMTLVRSEFHHGTDGANHTGGAAYARDPQF